MKRFFKKIAYISLCRKLNKARELVDRIQYTGSSYNPEEFYRELDYETLNCVFTFIGCVIVILMLLAVFVCSLLNTIGVLNF